MEHFSVLIRLECDEGNCLQSTVDLTSIPGYCMERGIYGLRGSLEELRYYFEEVHEVSPEFLFVQVTLGEETTFIHPILSSVEKAHQNRGKDTLDRLVARAKDRMSPV